MTKACRMLLTAQKGNTPEPCLAAASQRRCGVRLKAPIARIGMPWKRRGVGLHIHQFDIAQVLRTTNRELRGIVQPHTSEFRHHN